MGANHKISALEQFTLCTTAVRFFSAQPTTGARSPRSQLTHSSRRPCVSHGAERHWSFTALSKWKSEHIRTAPAVEHGESCETKQKRSRLRGENEYRERGALELSHRVSTRVQVRARRRDRVAMAGRRAGGLPDPANCPRLPLPARSITSTAQRCGVATPSPVPVFSTPEARASSGSRCLSRCSVATFSLVHLAALSQLARKGKLKKKRCVVHTLRQLSFYLSIHFSITSNFDCSKHWHWIALF